MPLAKRPDGLLGPRRKEGDTASWASLRPTPKESSEASQVERSLAAGHRVAHRVAGVLFGEVLLAHGAYANFLIVACGALLLRESLFRGLRI